jgi:hypothetical protein
MGNPQFSGGAFYMQAVPNSHYWTNLKQIIAQFDYNQKMTQEHIIVGLRNAIKHGYKIVPTTKFNLVMSPVFTSIDEIIEYVRNANYDEKAFYAILNNSVNTGFNLTNGRKMERTDVYKRIDGERDYQDAKWGTRREADGTPDEEKPVAEWINYMEFHLQKAKNAVYYLDTKEALAELRKVTALGVRAMEIHGCPERVILPEPDDKPNCCGGDCECKK